MKDKNKIYPFEKQLNFIKLMDEAMNENLYEIEKELEEQKINIKEIQNNLLNFIKEQRAKILIKKGKIFQKNYDEEKKNSSAFEVPQNIAFAFRKDEDKNSTDSLTDEDLKKLAMLKKAKDKISGKSDEQSNKDS